MSSGAEQDGVWKDRASSPVTTLTCSPLPTPSLGLQVVMLGLAGADPEQLRRLVPGMDPIQTFLAVDDGASLDRAVSDLAVALCQVSMVTQVWTRPPGAGGGLQMR